MAGFEWNGSLDGSEPIIQEFVVANTVVLSAGELVNLESGEVDAGATADVALVGVSVGDVDNTDDGEIASVIINPNAIYSVDDANARSAGDTLDIASGGMSVAATSNADLLVVSDSTADEPTRVTFNGTHFTQV